VLSFPSFRCLISFLLVSAGAEQSNKPAVKAADPISSTKVYDVHTSLTPQQQQQQQQKREKLARLVTDRIVGSPIPEY
jgi:uncharacterized membrane protein YgcG